MVAARKPRHLEGNGRDHEVPIRDSLRPRHGHSIQPAISGLENIINGLLKKDQLASHLEPILRRVVSHILFIPLSLRMNMRLKKILLFLFCSFISASFEHLVSQPRCTSNCKPSQNASHNLLQVRQEVERKIQEYLLSSATPSQAGTSGAKTLELRFINEPHQTTFTHTNVKAEDEETPLKVALFDVRSQSVVSDGPLSSAKVEIFPLDGDFCSKRREDWTEEEFNASILFPREGKEPLLNGDDRIITLKNGVGCITNVKITDNSRWRSSGKFSLGAKVLKLTSSGASIKEGVSKPFRVKDNRGELYKKHHPPNLDDDLFRLEKISKNGVIYQRLCGYGIRTVRDFVRSYNIDPSSLLEKFGKIPRKSWEAITKHVKECVKDDYNLYMYHTAEQPVGLLFDSVYTLVGVTFDGQSYFSPDTLASAEKSLVEVVKQHAYKNLNDLKSVGDQTRINFQRQWTYPQAGQASGPDQGQIETWAGSDQAFISYAVEGMQNDQIYANPFTGLAPMLLNNSAEEELLPAMQTEGNSCPHLGSLWTENENPNIQFTNWGQENGLYFNPYGAAVFGRSEKPKAVWYKIRTALKWVISVRRDAAAKRMAKLIRYND